MVTLNQKQLKRLIDLAAVAGRLDELNRIEGHVPSAFISRRKGILKRQLVDGIDEEKSQDEQTINIRIEVPTEEKRVAKKEKSLAINLKNILSGNFGKVEEDDDDDTFVVLSKLLPAEHRSVMGKIVKEL